MLRFILSTLAGLVVVLSATNVALAHTAACKGTLRCIEPVPGQGQTTCGSVKPAGNGGCSAYGECTSNCFRTASGCSGGDKQCACSGDVPDHGSGVPSGECDICYSFNSYGNVTSYSCMTTLCTGTPAIECEVGWTGQTGETTDGKPYWEFDCLCR